VYPFDAQACRFDRVEQGGDFQFSEWFKIEVWLDIEHAFFVVAESYEQAVIGQRGYIYGSWAFH